MQKKTNIVDYNKVKNYWDLLICENMPNLCIVKMLHNMHVKLLAVQNISVVA
jgi:hypothetical protein